MGGVNCSRCSHFFITWVLGTPYGCAAWGIKSGQYPHLAVYAFSGMECQLFERKQPKSDGAEKKRAKGFGQSQAGEKGKDDRAFRAKEDR